jgi:hypothetical protein
VDASYEPVSRFRASVRCLVYFTAPKWLIYFYVIVLSLTYVIVRVHSPLTLIPSAPHDDGLFMSLGRSLAEGEWLGPYNQFTLMKGPGYPAFLAVANWLGISASLAHALFYCAASVFFVAIAHRFVKSHLISGLLLALLLGQLLPTTVYFDRILREQITGSQLLFLFASAAGALFYAREKKWRLLFAALTGFFLGWLWLTREEGIWILPGAMVLIGAAIYRGHRMLRLREFAGTIAVMIAVFGTIQLGFAAVNWAVYGKFVGVDFKETNYQRALRAIDSVRSGGTKDFVSITHTAMKRVDAVSPAFASLAPYFDGPGKGWQTFTCSQYPSACGEIGSGWFVWALRGAAQTMGHYSSPAQASAFFGRIADEITAACGRGELDCKPQLIAEMPPINWTDVIGRVPSLYSRAFKALLLLHPPLRFNPSWGPEAELIGPLHFLNYPLYAKPSSIASSIAYSLSGWYYKFGDKWLWATVREPNGSSVSVRFDRNASPDIQTVFKDPKASNQRFVMNTRCNDECTLELQSQDNEIIQKKLSEFRHGPIGFDLGKGHVHVDSTIVVDPIAATPLVVVVSGHLRQAALNNYGYILVLLLVPGAILFLVTSLLYWRRVLLNVCYIMALCSWGLVVTRVSLLVLISATSFFVVIPNYLWPAHLLLVTGALFSCVAWLQLKGRASAGIGNFRT